MPVKNQAFQNPTAQWTYDGPFTIEVITSSAERVRAMLPPRGSMKGNTLSITAKVESEKDGVRVNSKGCTFVIPFKEIVEIRCRRNLMLWKNEN